MSPRALTAGNVAAFQGRTYISRCRRCRVAEDMMLMTHTHILLHRLVDAIVRPATLLTQTSGLRRGTPRHPAGRHGWAWKIPSLDNRRVTRGMSVSSVASVASCRATLSGLETPSARRTCLHRLRKEWQLMPRRYGPGHFTEDPYSQIVSPHGIPVDDLVAVLQKEIRRSRIDNAVLAAYEMFITSPDVAQHLWRRLRLIAVEDVGMGLPLGPALIDVLHRNFNDAPGGDWMMACHAVRLLASAPKDRASAEHADWVATKVALGEALVEVPDYAHCVHTRAGQELGRGLMQWWDNGAQVRDELPSADHRYRDELIEIHRRDEAENGIAPRPSRWQAPPRLPTATEM